jgi:hypothetical protein
MRTRPIQDQSGRKTFRRRSRIALKCLACALTRVSACSIAVAATIASPARRPVASAYSSRNRNEPAFDLARIIHEGFVKNPGLPDEQPFSPATGNYVVAGGPGTHPPGWVRCHHPPATSDPFRTAAPKGSY